MGNSLCVTHFEGPTHWIELTNEKRESEKDEGTSTVHSRVSIPASVLDELIKLLKISAYIVREASAAKSSDNG